MTDRYDLQYNEGINITNGIIASSQDILMAKERGIAGTEEAGLMVLIKSKPQK